MCKGGVIAYEIDPLSGVSENWMLNYVVPNMVCHGLPCEVCIVFGRAASSGYLTGQEKMMSPLP
jgi:hypothetical protein